MKITLQRLTNSSSTDAAFEDVTLDNFECRGNVINVTYIRETVDLKRPCDLITPTYRKEYIVKTLSCVLYAQKPSRVIKIA